MDVKIGTGAQQFPEKEYINGIFVAVHVGFVDTAHCCAGPKKQEVLEWPWESGRAVRKHRHPRLLLERMQPGQLLPAAEQHISYRILIDIVLIVNL